jgi:alpha-beta hydrolase superfamily lysophospholipase
MYSFSAFVLTLFLLALLFPMALHWIYRAPRVAECSTPEHHGLPFTQHYLRGVKNKRLYAWLIHAQEKQTTLVVVHGWGANAEMMLPLAQPFHQAGMDVLLYDARNHGKSDADSFSSLPRFAEDLNTALNWVKRRNPQHRLILLGHSIGSAAAILAASHRDDIDLVIGLSGFAHPDLVMKRHLERPWLPRFLRPLILNYIQWVIGFRFEDIAPMNRIPHVSCPVLLAHGTEDTVVPISDMRLIEANAPSQWPIRVLAIEGARHDSVEHFQRHAGELINFIRETLEPSSVVPSA